MSEEGLTDKGFVTKDLEQMRSEVNSDYKNSFGDSVNLGSDSVIGRIRDPILEQIDLGWQAIQDVVTAFDPDKNEGQSQNNTAAIRGFERKDAEYSTGEVTCTGTNGTVIEKGSEVRTSTTKAKFVTTEEKVIEGGSVIIPIRSKEKGPIKASAGDIDTIVTQVQGWNSVSNSEDVDPGRLREQAPDFRIRQERSIATNASGTVPALETALRGMSGVDNVTVLSNQSNQYDTDLQMPIHSLKPIIWPDPTASGSDIDESKIFETIFVVGPPKEYVGTEKGIVTDIEGRDHTVAYYPADEREVYIDVSVTTTDSTPSNYKSQIEDLMLDEGDQLDPGDDVIWLQLIGRLDKVSGLTDGEVKIGLSANPSKTDNIQIDPDEIATFDSSRISVS